ncbi:hypothetical protein SAMN05216267_10563 [Actinacidiphila rubida]|uniref:Uncharacterized protein n=1 Tax=Actinacidiphila rubida TaxID=310780 RepID=A0A1H8TNV7_9ACTN|nr:hypothetical protein SAMN05216267_10563 [Actinacidiphila rubida]
MLCPGQVSLDLPSPDAQRHIPSDARPAGTTPVRAGRTAWRPARKDRRRSSRDRPAAVQARVGAICWEIQVRAVGSIERHTWVLWPPRWIVSRRLSPGWWSVLSSARAANTVSLSW